MANPTTQDVLVVVQDNSVKLDIINDDLIDIHEVLEKLAAIPPPPNPPPPVDLSGVLSSLLDIKTTLDELVKFVEALPPPPNPPPIPPPPPPVDLSGVLSILINIQHKLGA